MEITSKNGHKYIVGSLYRSLNTNPENFITHVHSAIDMVHARNKKASIIMGMDHNMDLLKTVNHHATSAFLDDIVEREVYPTITRPMHITQTSATLIDNVFISKDLHNSFDSGILMADISDHLPTLVLLKQNKLTKREPLEFASRNLTDTKIGQICDELIKMDWSGALNSECVTTNCNTFSKIVENTLNKFAPMKKVRISKNRRHIEPWMTKGIERSQKHKLKFYHATLKKNCNPEDMVKYKKY